MKQINNTLVIGTIIVPKQECFVLEKYTKEAIYISEANRKKMIAAIGEALYFL